MAVAFGAPWITVVALKNIAAEVNGERSVPALAGALVWVGRRPSAASSWAVSPNGSACAGPVLGGAVMIAVGLVLSTWAHPWPLYVGTRLLHRLDRQSAASMRPSYVYVQPLGRPPARFGAGLDFRGSFLAGPSGRRSSNAPSPMRGGRHTMLFYARSSSFLIVPAAAIVLGAPPDTPQPHHDRHHAHAKFRPGLAGQSGFHSADVCDLHLLRGRCRCPQAHLVAFCGGSRHQARCTARRCCRCCSLGILESSVWGALSDRIARGLLQPCWFARHARRRPVVVHVHPGRTRTVYGFGAVPVLASAALVPALSWPRASCSSRRKPIGRIPTLLLCSGTAWRRRLDRRHSSTTISAITRRPLPPASASVRSIS